jgi:MSHA biogenesis protein MshM
MTLWLLGHASLIHTLDRAPYATLASRIQARVQLRPITDRDRFKALIGHALNPAGVQHILLSDSGLEFLRQLERLSKLAVQLAVPKGLNHLPDDLIQQAIEGITGTAPSSYPSTCHPRPP